MSNIIFVTLFITYLSIYPIQAQTTLEQGVLKDYVLYKSKSDIKAKKLFYKFYKKKRLSNYTLEEVKKLELEFSAPPVFIADTILHDGISYQEILKKIVYKSKIRTAFILYKGEYCGYISFTPKLRFLAIDIKIPYQPYNEKEYNLNKILYNKIYMRHTCIQNFAPDTMIYIFSKRNPIYNNMCMLFKDSKVYMLKWAAKGEPNENSFVIIPYELWQQKPDKYYGD